MDYTEQTEKISALLTAINKNIHRELARHIEDFGLTVPQIILLRILLKGPLPVSQISKRMGLTNSTVSGIIDRLEKEGFVARKRDLKDRRVVFVELTERSRELKKSIPIFKSDYFANWIKELPPEKVQGIIDALSELAKVFK